MGSHPTPPASPSRPARQARPTSGRRPGLLDRHRVRAAERPAVGDAPAGNGLWLGHDLLATAAVLAAPWCLEETPARLAAAHRPRAGDRLGALLPGQPELPRGFWGVLTGKNPTDRAKKGSK